MANTDIVEAAFKKADELAADKAAIQEETAANRTFLRLLADQGLVDKPRVDKLYPTRERKAKAQAQA